MLQPHISPHAHTPCAAFLGVKGSVSILAAQFVCRLQQVKKGHPQLCLFQKEFQQQDQLPRIQLKKSKE
ncbi:uncharacterized [Tachysurus ichikawai]